MEETISSKLLHKGKYFSFKTDRVKLSNGTETIRDIVDHPGAVAIIPVIDDDLILVKQYRYAAAKELWEIPAGTLEPDEDPYACAVRELREETGYAGNEWTKIISTYMAPGYSNEIIHFFVANGLSEVGTDLEEDEDITIQRFSFNKILEMIEDNTIEDSKTVTGVLVYLTRTSP